MTEAAVAATDVPSLANEEGDDDSFLAGFSGASGQSPAKENAATPATEKSAADTFADEVGASEDAAATQAAADAAAATPAVTSEPLTPDEITALREFQAQFGGVRQGLDKLAGTVGGMNRTLLQLQQIQRVQPSGSPAAEGARKLEDAIKAAMEETVGEQYPELTPRLIEGLTKVFSATAPAAAPSVDVDAIEANLTVKMEQRFLQRAHPNWQVDIAAKDAAGQAIKGDDGRYLPSEQFVAWMGSKPEQYRATFMSTNDADFLSAALDEFKASATPAQAPAPTPALTPAPAPAAAPAAAAPKTGSKARLAAAVVPTGTPGAAPPPQLTEDEAMEAGFKSVRRM